MIAGAKAWFQLRSLRERRLLLVMAALLIVTIAWAGVIRPLSDGMSSQRQRHADAVLRLADTEARLDVLHGLQRGAPPPIDGPLDGVVRQRAGEAGFTLSNVTVRSSDRIEIAIATARPGALFGWIADLEAAGIVVATINVTNNGDQTVAAQMTLIKRGR